MRKKEREIIDGLILSDAYVDKQGTNARLCFSLKHKDFAVAIVNSLPSLEWSPIKSTLYIDKRTNKEYCRNVLRSKVHSYLTQQRQRWYSNGKKIVPQDIYITPEVMLWWHLGDGHLAKKKSRPNYRQVCLATNCFSLLEVNFLIEKLSCLLGTSESIYEEFGRIIIGQQALCSFALMLKNKNPVSVYDYKFNFGQYLNKNYFKDSFLSRPLHRINEYRRKNKVREFDLKLLEN